MKAYEESLQVYRDNYNAIQTIGNEKVEEKVKEIVRELKRNGAREIHPGKELQKFLTEEDFEFYKKALMNLEHNYGIGAFTYFRRIVENEIIRLIKEVADLNDNESLKKKIKNHENRFTLEKLKEKNSENKVKEAIRKLRS